VLLLNNDNSSTKLIVEPIPIFPGDSLEYAVYFGISEKSQIL